MRNIRSADFFPYFRLWRIRQSSQFNHNCSVIVSLLLLAGVLAILITQMISVFQKETITSTSKTIYNISPPLTTFTTQQDDQQHAPFMLAFEASPLSYPPYPATIDITIQTYTSTQLANGSFQTTNNRTLNLENCTASHFSALSNYQQEFKRMQASQWKCLPINTSFEIQGNSAFDSVYKYFGIKINHTTPVPQSSLYPMNYVVKVHSLRSGIDPQQPDALVYYLDFDQFYLNRYGYHYNYRMNENFVDTDRSVYPWKEIEKTKAVNIKLDPLFRKLEPVMYDYAFITISRSQETKIYTRQTKKILGGFAYIGGLFQSILGAFFFMGIITQKFFEVKLANFFFDQDTKVLSQFGFIGLLKLWIYKLAKSLGCHLQWKQSQAIQEYTTTVNHLMDITFLQERIYYLERIISSLLSQHDINMIYLSNKIKKDRINRRLKICQYRKRYVKDKEEEEEYHIKGFKAKQHQRQAKNGSMIKEELQLKRRKSKKKTLNNQQSQSQDDKLKVSKKLSLVLPKDTFGTSKEFIQQNYDLEEHDKQNTLNKKQEEQYLQWIDSNYRVLYQQAANNHQSMSHKILNSIKVEEQRIIEQKLRQYERIQKDKRQH